MDCVVLTTWNAQWLIWPCDDYINCGLSLQTRVSTSLPGGRYECHRHDQRYWANDWAELVERYGYLLLSYRWCLSWVSCSDSTTASRSRLILWLVALFNGCSVRGLVGAASMVRAVDGCLKTSIVVVAVAGTSDLFLIRGLQKQSLRCRSFAHLQPLSMVSRFPWHVFQGSGRGSAPPSSLQVVRTT